MGHLSDPVADTPSEGAFRAPSAFPAGVPVGRFAPSPTGLLHAGSLLAAVASYCDIRSRGGRWLVRVEDIDPLREQAGASDAILRSLEAHGLHADGEIVFQSRRHAHYEAAIEHLLEQRLAYWCTCSRKQLQETAGVYPGTCRGRHSCPDEPAALRLLTTPTVSAHRDVAFVDELQGDYRQCFGGDTGDFVIKRKEGFYAYHLAVVVDDALQGITDIMRGIDLLESTPAHLLLQEALGLPTPRYAHLPVIVNADGQKLSKQTFAPALDPARAPAQLDEALTRLGHRPPPALRGAPPHELLDWATRHWDRGRLPTGRELPSDLPCPP